MPETTPNRNLPYPISTDPVNVAGDIQQLAEAVDALQFDALPVQTGNTHALLATDGTSARWSTGIKYGVNGADNDDLIVETSSGNSIWQIANKDNWTGQNFYSYGSWSEIDFLAFGGTQQNPTALAAGDTIGGIFFQAAYSPTGYASSAGIQATVTAPPDAGAWVPSKIEIKTTRENGYPNTITINGGAVTSNSGSFGPWEGYTPQLWNGGNLGNGFAGGKKCQIGKTMFFSGWIELGTTTSIPGDFQFFLPSEAAYNTDYFFIMKILDASANITYSIDGYAAGIVGTPYEVFSLSWGAGDFISFSGVYEIL